MVRLGSYQLSHQTSLYITLAVIHPSIYPTFRPCLTVLQNITYLIRLDEESEFMLETQLAADWGGGCKV